MCTCLSIIIILILSIYRIQNITFSELVVECQQLMRQFACEQLRKLGVNESDAKLRASSCVSQRDIQVWETIC